MTREEMSERGFLNTPSIEFLGEKRFRVFRLVESGVKWRDVAAEMGLCLSNVRSAYKDALRRLREEVYDHSKADDTLFGLRYLTMHALMHWGFDTREKVSEAFFAGKLKPGKMRFYGKRRHKEVERWLVGDVLDYSI